MGRRILVVDDEPQIREVLVGYLRSEGFEVLEAADGHTAVELARTAPPDLILLDVLLPDIDGLEVLRRLRTFTEVYVILITARSEETDKVVGLAVGADDYITKPFSPREVTARVKAVLRRARGASAPDETLRFPGMALDAARRQVTVDDEDVELSALEFDLLAALATSPGRVFSRRQLLQQVWGYDFYGDERVVDVHIRGIRRRIGDDANEPRFIGTVRGVGYKFVPEPT